MDRNRKLALEMLDEIDRARGGGLPLEELEGKLWRLLDATDLAFPPTLAGRVEDFVLRLRRLQAENLSFSSGHDTDENRGSEEIFHEVTGELSRYLG